MFLWVKRRKSENNPKSRRALMRELVQADQRTTPHRSALDFSFSFGCVMACAWLGEHQRADLYQDKHTSCTHSPYTGLILVDGFYTITVR